MASTSQGLPGPLGTNLIDTKGHLNPCAKFVGKVIKQCAFEKYVKYGEPEPPQPTKAFKYVIVFDVAGLHFPSQSDDFNEATALSKKPLQKGAIYAVTADIMLERYEKDETRPDGAETFAITECQKVALTEKELKEHAKPTFVFPRAKIVNEAEPVDEDLVDYMNDPAYVHRCSWTIGVKWTFYVLYASGYSVRVITGDPKYKFSMEVEVDFAKQEEREHLDKQLGYLGDEFVMEGRIMQLGWESRFLVNRYHSVDLAEIQRYANELRYACGFGKEK